MGHINRVKFTTQEEDVAALLDHCVYEARRDANGVTLWQALVQAVARGTAEEIRRQALEVLLLPGRHYTDSLVQHGQLLANGDTVVELEIADRIGEAANRTLQVRRRRVRLERDEPGYLRVEVAMSDGDECATADFARLLCALHYEFGGFTECLVDGVAALPNVGLAVLCLRVEGYEDLAREVLQRHQRDSTVAEADAGAVDGAPVSPAEDQALFVAASGSEVAGQGTVILDIRQGAEQLRLVLATAEACRLLAGVAAALAGLMHEGNADRT
jgi:hypothetical protein